ncbi:hypothetical protein BS50DRAFT_280722 [Corynespora cassiicola Philippines]|uniref:Uncharacterized protein n=1 Tax=Corynespora cassiicola Philippines TaxID=1448308 RepID=A0A2T2P115_CORCC|nr:hypothetical protein BS50DRAFT_280722 [Corynespora cassiicola Philippines]
MTGLELTRCLAGWMDGWLNDWVDGGMEGWVVGLARRPRNSGPSRPKSTRLCPFAIHHPSIHPSIHREPPVWAPTWGLARGSSRSSSGLIRRQQSRPEEVSLGSGQPSPFNRDGHRGQAGRQAVS